MTANAIVTDIRAGIAAGQYRYGTRLPSVRDLAEQYGVSQQTAAAAYAVLAALGLTRTAAGSGTTVTAGPAADAYLGTYSPPDLAQGKAWTPSVPEGAATEETYLVRQSTAPAEWANWGLPEASSVVERHRVRRIDDVPVQHKLTVLPYEVANRRPEGHEGLPPMLAPVGAPPLKPPHGVRVADWLGWDVARTTCQITADPMPAAASTALGMPEGSPGFQIVSIAKTADGSTLYVTVTTAPLHHRVTMEIQG
ncbi:GntR family transcriptional regulator [Streptomyces sp. SID8352]|uniref:GntR family transcriptional regulator n=1 Tax=Streptomyces sp. SID8352 TaxID=2690338 RepID=UPI00136FC315|nr:GntR family transcriptional regulator [Streptomyces sp. SID8352]MYU23526.1 GntR family transcriptional regulator [Streptomyces sp. SID8352]